MRIAQIAPLYEAVPPKLYGGTERVVAYLSDELVKLGHKVTLFASGDSATLAELHAVWPQALRLDPSIRDPIAPHILLMETVRRLADEFDVLHFHNDYLPFPLFSRQRTPWLNTLHGRLDLPEFQAVASAFPNVNLVSISNAQRRPVSHLNFIGTVYHGLPENLLRPQPVQPGYLAFLGRISPEKGPDRAIRIARRAGLPLKIAAKVDNADRQFFEAVVRPLLAEPGVEMIGEINEAQKPGFLSGARALLMPIDWPASSSMMSHPRLRPLHGWMRSIARRCASVSRRVSPRAGWPRITLHSTKSSSRRGVNPGCGLLPEAQRGLSLAAVSAFVFRRNRSSFEAKHGL
jgi:glycosyltransferase involved in cell wall biosynthesis